MREWSGSPTSALSESLRSEHESRKRVSPPPGVDASGMKLLYDESQGTAIFIGFFDTEEKMREASVVFEQIDPGDTPGTRASIDLCEVKIERDVG